MHKDMGKVDTNIPHNSEINIASLFRNNPKVVNVRNLTLPNWTCNVVNVAGANDIEGTLIHVPNVSIKRLLDKQE